MVKRIVNISKSHSFFLFGPRGSGKTTLLNHHFSDDKCLHIDLLDYQYESLLYKDPNQLIQIIESQKSVSWVIIDEIQKNPKLLDVVHKLTLNKKYKFALTGSSARKLKRQSANLLAGRAFNFKCHPLTSLELGKNFNLNEALKFGLLPAISSLSTADKRHFLRSYIDTYFKEEIVAEQIVRNLRPFRNFLDVAAQMNGKILNINHIARDVGVDHSTVQNYFEILEDTLVGLMLEPYHQSIRKRQRQASKFYYFDSGVVSALNKTLESQLVQSTIEYGQAFEHFVILEFRKYRDYYKPDWSLSYLRTKDDAEIDLIIERPKSPTLAIEIKSTNKISELSKNAFNTFSALAKDIGKVESFLLSQDPIERKIDHVWCLPWQKGLRESGIIDLD